jgi:hypothetical protein
MPAIHGVVRWRICDLCQWLYEEFRVSISKQTLSRELRTMGYRKLSARPVITIKRLVRLVDQPWRIISIGLRDWANAF